MRNQLFDTVVMANVDYNKFDLSNDLKTAFNMGQLVPTCVIETLPGDNFRINVENMFRTVPLISPVMHRVKATTHYYFVPNRILWSNWEKWITGQYEQEKPYVLMSSINSNSLGDYMGLPNELGTATRINAFPIAAYYKIYDEYYRDQNLVPEKYVDLVNGRNNTYEGKLNATPLIRAWNHDYFTSCLPFAQKGDQATLPLTDFEPTVQYNQANNFTKWFKKGTNTPMSFNAGVGTEATTGKTYAISYGDNLAYDPQGTLEIDVNDVAVNINTVRRAFRLQEWLEKNARGGTRYNEHILSHFGTKISDERVQRPEYIGGMSQNIVISEVLATAQATNYPIGTQAGHAISVGGSDTIDYFCEEHGYIIGITNVQPETSYQQGIDKHWSREIPLDYAWPSFAEIGEQEVYTRELYAQAPEGEVFGYIPRYSEMKFISNKVTGELKTNLNFWHMGRIFSTKPALNETFIQANPTYRIFADQSESSKVIAHIFHYISVLRKLPMFGIPTI